MDFNSDEYLAGELSEYLHQQEPGSRGFGRRNLYNMVTFYDKYSTPEFCEIAKSLTNSLFVQHKTQSEIVQMPSAQPATSLSNHYTTIAAS